MVQDVSLLLEVERNRVLETGHEYQGRKQRRISCTVPHENTRANHLEHCSWWNAITQKGN